MYNDIKFELMDTNVHLTHSISDIEGRTPQVGEIVVVARGLSFPVVEVRHDLTRAEVMVYLHPQYKLDQGEVDLLKENFWKEVAK